MTFDLPPVPTDLATNLRDLEQNAPNVTPKVIRAALVDAAKALEAWKAVAESSVAELEEASKLRSGQVDSQSKVDEVQKRVRQALDNVARNLKAKL